MSSDRWHRELEGRDAYDILGVSPTATAREISKAQRKRLATAHPDAGAGSDHLAKLITSAASILLDEGQRRDYDLWRTASAPAQAAPAQAPRAQEPPAPEPSLWDDANPGFDATPPPRRAQPRPTPPRTAPPRTAPPGPGPGPGPGPAPMYGSPNVMPHAGQAPPRYYHEPRPAKSRTGMVLLIVGGGVLLLCLGTCLLNGLLVK